jgi:hypothetical protein
MYTISRANPDDAPATLRDVGKIVGMIRGIVAPAI